MMREEAPLPLDPSTPGADHDGSAVLRLWRRVPSPVAAVLSGLFVFSVMQNGWFALFLINLEVMPRIPWSVPLGLLWLWAWFRYFGGKGWPASTAARRRRRLRAGGITAAQWGWSAAYFVVFLVFLTSVVNTVYRFQVIPEDPFDVSMLPWWTLYPALVMVSITAGVSEEAGFRGYMQGGLERRFGPVPAIAVTSLFFWLAHLNHPSGAARWALLIAMSVLLGALTWCAGSIRPAILAHAGLDTIFFVTGASDTAPWFFRQPPLLADTGVDAPFWIFSALLVLSGCAAALVLGKIAAASRGAGVAERSASAPGRP
jgi:membrane protease YdiL (CAAX protease family)